MIANRRRWALPFLVVLAVSLRPMGSADAQVLQIRTPYTTVEVEAGSLTTLDLEVVTSVPRRVDLDVPEIPEGWTATFRGGGFVVTSVFGDPEFPPSLQVDLSVAPGTGEGDHRVVIRGRSGPAESTLDLVLRVSATGEGAVTLTTDSPDLRATPGEQVEFDLSLNNGTGIPRVFALGAEVPDGWEASVHPTAEPNAAAVRLDGGGTTGLQASVTVGDEASTGTFSIPVRADGGDGIVAVQELEVVVDLGERIVFEPEDERLSATARAGGASAVGLLIHNDGSQAVRNVFFTAAPPEGWDVVFEPSNVSVIAPRDSARVVATIRPAEDTPLGDYLVDFTAQGPDTHSLTMRVTVRESRWWAVFSVLVIVGTVIWLRWMFRRYGRR